MSTKPDTTDPSTAPTVLTAYRAPTSAPTVSARAVTHLIRVGKVTPITAQGGASIRKSVTNGRSGPPPAYAEENSSPARGRSTTSVTRAAAPVSWTTPSSAATLRVRSTAYEATKPPTASPARTAVRIVAKTRALPERKVMNRRVHSTSHERITKPEMNAMTAASTRTSRPSLSADCGRCLRRPRGVSSSAGSAPRRFSHTLARAMSTNAERTIHPVTPRARIQTKAKPMHPTIAPRVLKLYSRARRRPRA